MSVLSQVLSANFQTQMEDTSATLHRVLKEGYLLNQSLLTELEHCHVTFLKSPSKKLSLLQEEATKFLVQEAALKHPIEELIKSNVSNQAFKDNVKLLDDLKQRNCALLTILKITSNLELLRELKNGESIDDCIQLISETNELIASVEEPLNGITSSVVNQFIQCKSSFQYKLDLAFDENFNVHYSETDCTIRLKNSEEFSEVVAASFNNNSTMHFQQFISCLINHVLTPIVMNTTTLEMDANEDDFVSLKLKIINKEKEKNPINVIDKVKSVFEFLSDSLTLVLVDDLSVMRLIGQHISDQLLDLIVKHNIDSIDFFIIENEQSYSALMNKIKDFEDFLEQKMIFVDIRTSLFQYAQSKSSCENRKIEKWAKLAKEIMEQDFQQTVQVCVDDETYKVSLNITEFLALKNQIEEECKSNLQEDVQDILSPIVNLFCVKYVLFCPQFYEKQLKGKPQIVALYYNNCTYLASHLTSEAFHINKAGDAVLQEFLRQQIELLTNDLKGITFKQSNEATISNEGIKWINQCLKHLQSLKNEWQHVLTNKVYNNTIGLLLNYFLNCVIENVLNCKEFPTEFVQQLIDTFKEIQIKCLELFPNVNDIHVYVKNLLKLNELHFMLNASLFEISDRWNNGKGKLAEHLTAQEASQLIQSLFPNNEQRSKIIKSICYL